MITTHTNGKVTWVDVVSPDANDVRRLLEDYQIPAHFAEDLTVMVPYSHTLSQKGFFKTTLDYPIVKRTDITHPHEVKYIVTKDTLISIHFEDIQAIERFRKEFEVLTMLGRKGGTQTGPKLLIVLMHFMYQSQSEKIDFLNEALTEIEAEIFAEREKEMVFAISRTSRRLMNLDQTLSVHESVLPEIKEHLTTAFGKKYTADILDLQLELAALLRRIDKLTQKLVETRRTNDSLLTTKQNEIMKTLTIMAFITFPLTLFTSMFGMNTNDAPIIGQAGDFWMIVLIMLVVSSLFFVYFKYKKWM